VVRPQVAETTALGAAYAEVGNFEDAMKWSKKAVELGEKEQLDDLRKELESYKARKPIRELKTGKEEKKPAAPSTTPPEKPKPAKPEPAKPAEKPKPK
jgi:glycerol kinase